VEQLAAPGALLNQHTNSALGIQLLANAVKLLENKFPKVILCN
jgi:hypothetical protein